MKLLFKQRFFSWLDSYDIYDVEGNMVFTVEGQFGWGHRLQILNAAGEPVGSIEEKIFSFLPQFHMYERGEYLGCIRKEFTLFKPLFTLDCADWSVAGEWMEWDYSIYSAAEGEIATVSKELFNWTDTYVIDVREPKDALRVLMVVLAIDAEKCSRD